MNKNIQQNNSSLSQDKYPKLDYTITDPQQRNKLVYQILQKIQSEKITPYYLEKLTKYLLETPANKKQKKILTDNRMVTINKRETSFQGLVTKLQNGEDGLYNFMTGGDKNIILTPKIEITQNDIETIPGLKELRQEIEKVAATRDKLPQGRTRSLLTKQLIQMRQEQYILKSFYKQPISMMKLTKSINQINLTQKIIINNQQQPQSNCLISFFNPNHICCLLCNYSQLKEQSWGKFESDWWYLMEDFDNLIERALKQNHPILYDIMIYKIDGNQNIEIIQKIQNKYNIKYTPQYISTIWRKKIPKIIANKAKEQYIFWYYTTQEYGQWKKCSRCKEIKLAHPYFFSKNSSAKDGWYSMCKNCRNKKSSAARTKKNN